MGKHRDPDTLKFLEWLKSKGETLGYVAELEYPMAGKKHIFDVVWKLRKEHSPLVIFEVETRDGRVIFCNSNKIYGPPSDIVPKPWHHFMIIFKGKLSKGHKLSLFNLVNQHNVDVIEDIFGNEENKKALEAKLDTLKPDISQQIKNEMRNTPLGESLNTVLKGLSEGLSDLPLGTPQVSVTFKSSKVPEGGTKFAITTDTAKGEPIFLDKLKEAGKTLKPFTIESPQLKDFAIEGKPVFPMDKGKAVLTITPTPSLRPVRLLIPRTDMSFDNILLRLVKTEGTTDYLSTEERNLPFIFNFMIDRSNEKTNKFDFEFKNVNADVTQALKFEDLIRAINAQKEIMIVKPDDNAPLLGFQVNEGLKQSEDWHYLLSKLAYIQKKTNQRISVPNKITQEDVKDIFTIIAVIDTGENSGTLNELTLKLSKPEVREYIAMQKNQGKIIGLKLSQTVSVQLFNEQFPFGKTIANLPDMHFALPLEEVEKLVDGSPDGTILSLSIKPIADNKIIIRFEDWQQKK
jgi:hypothetical protein